MRALCASVIVPCGVWKASACQLEFMPPKSSCLKWQPQSRLPFKAHKMIALNVESNVLLFIGIIPSPMKSRLL